MPRTEISDDGQVVFQSLDLDFDQEQLRCNSCEKTIKTSIVQDFSKEKGSLACPFCLSEDLQTDSCYVHSLREQIERRFEKDGENLEKSAIQEEHEENVVLFFDFYSQALNPPEGYLDALELMGKDSDKAWARVDGTYKKYCEAAGNIVKMPEFSSGEFNPLSDYDNVHERTSRAAGSFMETLWTNKLAFVKPTFPKQISEAYRDASEGSCPKCRRDNNRSCDGDLRYKGCFRDRCWDTLQSFFHSLQGKRAREDKKLGMHGNLHLWKTEKPFKPHLHFHCAIPMLQAPYLTSADREKELNSGKVSKLKQKYEDMPCDDSDKERIRRKLNNELAHNLGVEKLRMADRDKGYVFDADNLRDLWTDALEENWSSVVDDLDFEDCDSVNYGLDNVGDYDVPQDEGSGSEGRDKPVNVHVSWVAQNKEPESIMHKYRYKLRKPSIDFFRYYMNNDVGIEEHNNKDFMEHVFDYSNDSRVYGFMKWGKNLHEVDATGLENRCPICGGDVRDVTAEDFNHADSISIVREEFYGYNKFDPPPDSDLTSISF